MHCVVEIEDPLDLNRLPASSLVDGLSPVEFVRDGADAHLALVEDAELTARCSLWWKSPPPHEGHCLGVIGHYVARNPTAGRLLLDKACASLALRGCSLAVGPMDGNTWGRYRLVTDRGTEPAFFMEPDNPDDWPSHFLGLGFAPLARYRSALNRELSRHDPEVTALASRLDATGITIRAINLTRFDEEIRTIYAMTIASFARSLLYKPIDEHSFVAQCRQLAPRVNPDYVLIAERGSAAVGYAFGIPDWLQAARGDPVDTLVLKTVAVVPGRSQAGLGRVLAWSCEQRAAAGGHRRSIHALMHDLGTSSNISRDYTETMRRYTLFGRALQ